MASRNWILLPLELLEMQVAQIDLLMAMYPSEDELLIQEDTRALIEEVRQSCDIGEASSTEYQDLEQRCRNRQGVYFDLRLQVSEQDGHATVATDSAAGAAALVEVEIIVPLGHDAKDGALPDEPPSIKTRVRQPGWASKSDATEINDGIPKDEDVLSAIEWIRENASQKYADSSRANTTKGHASATSTHELKPTSSTYNDTEEALVRVWFYFPSISTRSKRDDLVVNAPAYGLTGFLLAGKPGLLCLEGGSRAIDEYMRFIKTESWGDIPAHHKKVSERYREEPGDRVTINRVFKDMCEITDTVGGERRGERANRGDMKAIEAWLTERGLGDAFTKVLI